MTETNAANANPEAVKQFVKWEQHILNKMEFVKKSGVSNGLKDFGEDFFLRAHLASSILALYKKGLKKEEAVELSNQYITALFKD